MKKVSKKQESGLTTSGVIATVNKKYGKNSIYKPGTLVKRMEPRLPTGNYALTLATGGGFPFWCMSRFLGPGSGGKTTAVMDAMKMASMLCWRCRNIKDYCSCDKEPLLQKTLFIDAEESYDEEWSECLGIDPNTYDILTSRDGNEQLAIAEAYLSADDAGLVIIDSAAMVDPSDSCERAIGDYKMGAQAKLFTDASKKLTKRLGRERGRGHACLILCTNQIRMNPGVMFGNPETEPCGKAFWHWITLGIRTQRLSFKNAKFMDEKRNTPLVQKHGFKVDKKRLYVYSQVGEYMRAVEDIYSKKDDGKRLFKKGQLMDHDLVLAHAEELDLVTIDDSGRVSCALGGEAKSRKAFQALLKKKEALYYQLHVEIAREERSKQVKRMEGKK